MSAVLSPTAPARPPSGSLEVLRAIASKPVAAIAALLWLSLALIALLAPWIAPHAPDQQFRDAILQPPVWSGGSAQFLLGTDDLGRDMLSRLMHGSSVTFLLGLLSVVGALVPGVVLGLVAAFFPRALGTLITRAMDVLLAIPGLLLAIAIVAVLGPGLYNAAVAIAIVFLPLVVRLTRASAMAELGKDYVMAERVAGASTARVMFLGVLPNCLAPLLVQATLGFSAAIIEGAALGFLGLGVQPPTAEWGTMLASARDYMDKAPWMVIGPGLCILLAVLSINLVGDALRDALDPRLKAL